jgi:hypothetical protein
VLRVVFCIDLIPLLSYQTTPNPGFDKNTENLELLKNRRFVVVKTFKDDVRTAW